MTIVTVKYESYVEDMKTMDVTINIAVDYVRSVDRAYYRLISVRL